MENTGEQVPNNNNTFIRLKRRLENMIPKPRQPKQPLLEEEQKEMRD